MEKDSLPQLATENSEFFCKEILHRYPEWISSYLLGDDADKKLSYDFFMREVMKMSGGSVNPSLVEKHLKRMLDQALAII